MDKRDWKLVYSSYEGMEKKAVELISKEMGAQILRDQGRYTIHVLACQREADAVIDGKETSGDMQRFCDGGKVQTLVSGTEAKTEKAQQEARKYNYPGVIQFLFYRLHSNTFNLILSGILALRILWVSLYATKMQLATHKGKKNRSRKDFSCYGECIICGWICGIARGRRLLAF